MGRVTCEITTKAGVLAAAADTRHLGTLPTSSLDRMVHQRSWYADRTVT